MKYLTIILLAILITSCGSNNDYLSVEEYVVENSLTTEISESTGLNYIIHNRGENETPSLSSTITIDYTGFFLGGDGGVFDQGTNVTFRLQNLIQGWQEGLQLIGKGGSITLLIPSNLAYGSRDSGSIPANTDIGFDITLIDFE